ncbi:putative short chain type dehydrogenase [Phyllosticta citribraziliensis]|uniref:Short chain type dehydrogenase n=1 Tax=Phyllosticta citribraziliensis TaxID=989973 RepID=A0ABR1LY17_9PEZI
MSSTITTQPWPNPRPLLPGKLAIVTGSSRGIGRAIALTYAYEGAAVVCADVSAAPHPRAGAEYRYLFDELAAAGADLLPTHETISKVGAKALFVETDVGVEKSVEALVERAVSWAEEIGLGRRLDIFVNNAGVAPEGNDPRPVWELNFERMWEPTMKINASGVMLGTKHAAKQMISQEPSQSGDRGSIVNISSIYGVTGTGLQVSYNASKHAVVAITKTAALDLAEYRVHVNAICPGYVDTRLLDPILVGHDEVRTHLAKKHPFRGLGKPNDFTRLAVYLGSDDNTWMTGTAIPVDGGFTAN